MAGDQVDQRTRHEEGRDTARAFGQQIRLRFFDARQTADARSDNDADAISVLFGGLET